MYVARGFIVFKIGILDRKPKRDGIDHRHDLFVLCECFSSNFDDWHCLDNLLKLAKLGSITTEQPKLRAFLSSELAEGLN